MTLTVHQPPQTHLAQLNIARALDALDSPRLADFMSAIDRVNAVAERSPGFIWRFTEDSVGASAGATTSPYDGGDGAAPAPSLDPRMVVNMSVWATPADFEHFVWKTVHKRVYEKKAKWFEHMRSASFAMWWVPIGTLPTMTEAFAKLEQLNAQGPSQDVFGWQQLQSAQFWQSQQCA